MLTILSLLAFLSDWICFSVAPIPAITEAAYEGMHPSDLVTIFLSTNVLFCFIEPFLIVRRGLRRVVVDGAWLMAVGCLLRSGLPGIVVKSKAMVVLGTMFVGAAQPFFQCTPAKLAANWFGPDERTVATTVAINANQIGIASSYIFGAFLVRSVQDIHHYFLLLTIAACSMLALTIAFFRTEPPTPPSLSGMERSDVAADGSGTGDGSLSSTSPTAAAAPSSGSGSNAVQQFMSLLTQMRRLLLARGFLHALAAFVISIGITNVVSTFLDHLLSHLGFSQQMVGVIGALFQVAIMIGSVVLSYVVDVTKLYFEVTIVCFGMSFFWLLCTSGQSLRGTLFVIAILALGFSVGPIQPITAEMAVEVTYPSDENAIVAVQQVFGNMFSALLVPLCNVVRNTQLNYGIRLDYVLLLLLCGMGGVYFLTFDAPLKRMLKEHNDDGNTDREDERVPRLLSNWRKALRPRGTQAAQLEIATRRSAAVSDADEHVI